MNLYRVSNCFLVCAAGLIGGLAAALALPWCASFQGLAAQRQAGIYTSRTIENAQWAPLSSDTTDRVPIIPGPGNKTASITKYYVSKSGDSSAPTLGWSSAFTSVQDALAAAAAPSEIWVAEGVYYPDEGSGQIDNSVKSTFILTNGVALYGGFDTSDTQLDERDWKTNITVLSGDIDKNDAVDLNGVVVDAGDILGVNAHNVLFAKNVSGSAVLDGFTITAGKARGEGGYYFSGGGFYCHGRGKGNVCSPTLRNISFSGNKAYEFGGGMYNNGSYDGNSSPSLTNVVFTGNWASDGGGGIYNDGHRGSSDPKLINVLFSGNYGLKGGAIHNDCYESTCNPLFTNITVSGNKADEGGGVYNEDFEDDSGVFLRNSILWNNLDSSGTTTISSSIYNDEATIHIMYSLVQGSGGSSHWISDTSIINNGHNIEQDPNFITAVDPSTVPTSEGNLRLRSASPAVNAGNNIYATVSSDLDGNNRIIDGLVDMGAFELPNYINTSLPLVFH